MKKKVLAISLAAILVLTAIAGTTLAYLTDRDSAKNVFTMGNVEIELNEHFPDNELIPGKKLDKQATITNTGKNDAWVWITVAIPAALDTPDDASKNILHMNVPGAYWDKYYTQEKYYSKMGHTQPVELGDTWNVDAYVSTVTIDNVEYTLYTHLYNGILKAAEGDNEGETTNTCLTSVYLDAHVDIDPDGNLFWVEKGTTTAIDWNINEDGVPSVYVSAYAIQAEGFDTVKEAYAAYAEQWGSNGTEYGAVTYPAAEVETTEASAN